MENYKTQSKHGTCGIYNLANMLRDKDILDYENKPEFIPCGNPEINKILKNEGYDFRIESLIASVSYKTAIPSDFLKTLINEFINQGMENNCNDIISFQLNIQTGDNEFTLHAVSLLYLNGVFIYSDPRYIKFEKLNSLDDIFTKCNYINSIQCFSKDSEFVALRKDLFETIEIFN